MRERVFELDRSSTRKMRSPVRRLRGEKRALASIANASSRSGIMRNRSSKTGCMFSPERREIPMKVTAHEFEEQFANLVQEERGITRQVVEMIAFCVKRKFYAELGYSSVMNWLMKAHGYPKSCAYRRIEAAKLVASVPEAIERLEEGRVNLSTLATLQSAIRQEEKRTASKITNERREELLSLIEDKTEEQAERVVAIEFPEIVKDNVESVKPVSATETRVNVVFTDEQMALLERVREITGHSHFGASWSELMVVMAKFYLKHNDPIQKVERAIEREEKKLKRDAKKSSGAELESNQSSGPELSPDVSPQLRAAIIFRDGGRCIYRDSETGNRCDGRTQLEVDHIVPRAFGGSDDPENLRTYCRAHNRFEADLKLGAGFMNVKIAESRVRRVY